MAYAVGQRGDQLRRQRFMTREVGWVESRGRVAGLRVMGIYAHPDDEAFSLAGSFARVTDAGHMAALLCATRGERGEIADPALATPETLGSVREQELRQACAEVGVDDVSFLGYSDGELAQAAEAEAVGRIVAHLRRFKPDVVVTFPWCASAEELRTLIGIESFVLAPPPLSAAAYPTPEHDLLAGL